MRVRNLSLLLALLALLALCAAPLAAATGVGVLTPEQTRLLVQEMKQHREAEKLSAESELDLALLESGADARSGDVFLDETEPRVMVEADAATEDAQEQQQQGGHKEPAPAAAQASGPPASAAELLQPRLAGQSGQNTFFDAPTTPTRPERSRVVSPRIERAKYHLAKRAHQEHVKEYEMYQRKLAQYNWARAVEQGRQATKFERKLYDKPAPPAAASNAASFNGDRLHNTLFPAATAKSDGKAAAVQRDFQHRGRGDAYANHLHMVDGAQQAAGPTAPAPAGFVKPTIDPSLAQLDAQSFQAPQTPKRTISSKPKAAAPAANPNPKGSPPPGPAEPAGMDPPLANDGMPPPPGPAEPDNVDPPLPNDGMPPELTQPAGDASAPQTATEPCAAQCDVVGGWRTAACQDCLMRGMVNGWIVRSIADAQAGYNYAHYARNKCVSYVNDLQLRGGEVKGAPFAHCFFQRMHETCNL